MYFLSFNEQQKINARFHAVLHDTVYKTVASLCLYWKMSYKNSYAVKIYTENCCLVMLGYLYINILGLDNNEHLSILTF